MEALNNVPDAVAASPLDSVPDAIAEPSPIADKLKTLAKQVMSGFVASPLVAGPAIYGLADKGISYLRGADETLPGGNASMKLASDIQQGVNEKIGVGNPADTTEEAAQVLGSVLLPVPGGGFAKVLSYLPKTAQWAARVLEAATPMTVGPSVGKYAANLGVGVGLAEAGHAITGDPTYKSQIFPSTNVSAATEAMNNAPAALTTNDVALNDVPLALAPPIDMDAVSPVIKVAGLVGIAMAAGGALYMMRRPDAVLRNTTIVGSLPGGIETATTGMEAARTVGQDATAVLTSQVERAAGQAAAKGFADKVAANARSGGASRIEATQTTGIFPGGAIRGPAMLDNQRNFAQRMPEQQQTFIQGMSGEDLVESRFQKRMETGNPTLVTDLPAIDDATAASWVAKLNSDPDLAALAGNVRSSMNNALMFAAQEGRITNAFAQDLLKTRPNFSPMRHADPAMSEAEYDMFMKRTNTPEQGAQEIINPMQSAESYVSELMRRVLNNNLRRDWIDKTQNGTTAEAATIRNSMQKVDARTSTTVTVYRNGVPEFWDMADPLVANAAQFNPISLGNMLDVLPRTTYQATTTGPLQPTVSARNLIWDSIGASVLRPTGRSFGYLDQAIQAATGGKLALRGDLTGIAGTALSGLPRTVGARIAGDLASRIEADLATGSGLWNMLPKGMSTLVATRMRDAYLGSLYHILESEGGKNAALLQDDLIKATAVLKNSTGAFASGRVAQILGATGLRDLWNFYTAALDSMQNAARIQYIVHNRGRAPDSTLVAEARSVVGGDLSKKGLGPSEMNTTAPNWVEKAINIGIGSTSKFSANEIPYANATIQTLAKYAEAANADRLRFAGGLLASVGSVAVASMAINSLWSEEQRRWYWSQPAWWRFSRLSFPVGDRPEQRIELPVPPEHVMVTGPIQAGVDQAIGFSTGAYKQSFSKDMWQAFGDAVGTPAPPLANFALALTGQQLTDDPGTGMPKVGDIKGSPVAPGLPFAGSVMATNIQEMIASIFGTTGRQFINILEAIHSHPQNEPAANAALEQYGHDLGTKMPVISAPLTGKSDYVGNDVSAQLGVKKEALDHIDQYMTAIQRALQSPPALMNMQLSQLPTESQSLMKYAATWMKANPQIKDIQGQLAQEGAALEALKGTFPKTKKTEQSINATSYRIKVQNERMMRAITELESQLGTTLDKLDPTARPISLRTRQ